MKTNKKKSRLRINHFLRSGDFTFHTRNRENIGPVNFDFINFHSFKNISRFIYS